MRVVRLAAKMVGSAAASDEPKIRLCSSRTWRVGVFGFILLKAWMSADSIFAEDYTFRTLAWIARRLKMGAWTYVANLIYATNRKTYKS